MIGLAPLVPLTFWHLRLGTLVYLREVSSESSQGQPLPLWADGMPLVSQGRSSPPLSELS